MAIEDAEAQIALLTLALQASHRAGLILRPLRGNIHDPPFRSRTHSTAAAVEKNFFVWPCFAV